jgi:hypothetical protein
MKSAEQMMVEWMESEIEQYGKVKLKAKQFYEIYDWYKSVELLERKVEAIMGYNKRTDLNHQEIRDGLRKAGYVVKDLSRCGEGIPDLLVRGDFRIVMLEIKNGSAKLTEAEKEFHDVFRGLGIYIVRTLEQALDVMRKEQV